MNWLFESRKEAAGESEASNENEKNWQIDRLMDLAVGAQEQAAACIGATLKWPVWALLVLDVELFNQK